MTEIYIRQLLDDKIVAPLNALLDVGAEKKPTTERKRIIKDIEFWLNTLWKEHKDDIENVLMPFFKELVLSPEEKYISAAKYRQNNCDAESELKLRITQLIYGRLPDRVYAEIIKGMDLYDLLERSLYLESKRYHHTGYFMTILLNAVKYGYTTDWNDLYDRVEAELLNGPKDYSREKLEYFCFLKTIVIIARAEDIPVDKKREFLMILKNVSNWNIFASVYSILTGQIIGSRFKKHIEIINLFSNAKKEYAHLLLSVVKYRPDLFEVDDPKKQQNYDDALNKLVMASKEECANHVLDELFNVVFPETALEVYSNIKPRLTAAETQKRLDEQMRVIDEQTKVINDQQIELSELRLYREAAEKLIDSYADNAISIDDLKQAVNAIRDPEKAQQFYFQLNHLLRKNPTWKKHQEEFADFIDEKINAEELIETINKNATQPMCFNAEKVIINSGGMAKQDLNFNNTVGQVVAHADKIVNSKEDEK